jgi:hypothetical protein
MFLFFQAYMLDIAYMVPESPTTFSSIKEKQKQKAKNKTTKKFQLCWTRTLPFDLKNKDIGL